MGSGAGVVAESRISPARAGWTGLLTGKAVQAGFADGPRTGTPKAPGRWTEARRATGKCSPALQDRSASDGSPDAALRHCRQSNHGRGTDMSHTGGPDPDGRGRRGVISRRGASRSVRCTGPGTKRSRAAAGFLMGWSVSPRSWRCRCRPRRRPRSGRPVSRPDPFLHLLGCGLTAVPRSEA